MSRLEMRVPARKLSAFAGALLVAAGALGACDPEDRRDVREGVEDVRKAGEEAAEDAEEAIDETVDSDGKDD